MFRCLGGRGRAYSGIWLIYISTMLLKTRFALHVTLMFLAFLFSAGFLLSCSREKKYQIGVSQCSYDDWRLKLNDEIMREALLFDDLEVEIVSAYDDPKHQEQDIHNFISKGVDVIIASPQNGNDLNRILSEARKKGIKVIVFDREPTEKCYDLFVGADNQQLGLAAGKYLLHRLGGQGKLIEIEGASDSSPAKGRHIGFRQALEKAPGAVCVGSARGDWNADCAERVADSLLRIYPDVDAVYAHNDRMALGVRKAADKLGLKNLLIAGTDAVPEVGIQAVVDKKIDATFMYPTAGKELVELGHSAAAGEKLQDQLIISSALPVDESNAEILLQLAKSIEDEKGKISFLQERVDRFTTRHNEQRILLIVIGIAALLFGAVIFFLLRLIWQRHRHQIELDVKYHEIEQQHRDLAALNEKLREATQSKLLFFTNVSHDLRTPLTLIAEPVKQLLESHHISGKEHTLLRLADKNIRILNRLINQILDFRKYENGKLQLNRTETDLIRVFTEWSESFKILALQKDIRYNLSFRELEIPTAGVDVEKMERIFFNLMSNAFKFTPVKGIIETDVSAIGNVMTITVSDTGKGMAAEEAARIFERFYQADKIKPGGSGIGLAVVKAFVELHEGTIKVESTPGKGTTFTITMPIVHVSESSMTDICQADVPADDKEVNVELGSINEGSDILVELNPELPTLLVIDDTSDLRTLIRISLGDRYNILEAPNGEHGIRLAMKYSPDIIICDLMMPGMGGRECCRRIKEEELTAHIPIIMLTACEMDEERRESLEAGVDVYMTKPFDIRLLEAQCRSLKTNRQRVLTDSAGSINLNVSVGTYRSSVSSRVGEKKKSAKSVAHTAEGIESEFYTRFLEIINSEIGNPDISVEEIGNRLGISRVHFYRKIKSITGYSPVEVLRIQRLKFAHRRLTSEECTIAEVAYSVGFSSPSYFSKCFKEQYGELPLDLQKRTSKMG